MTIVLVYLVIAQLSRAIKEQIILEQQGKEEPHAAFPSVKVQAPKWVCAKSYITSLCV